MTVTKSLDILSWLAVKKTNTMSRSAIVGEREKITDVRLPRASCPKQESADETEGII